MRGCHRAPRAVSAVAVVVVVAAGLVVEVVIKFGSAFHPKLCEVAVGHGHGRGSHVRGGQRSRRQRLLFWRRKDPVECCTSSNEDSPLQERPSLPASHELVHVICATGASSPEPPRCFGPGRALGDLCSLDSFGRREQHLWSFDV